MGQRKILQSMVYSPSSPYPSSHQAQNRGQGIDQVRSEGRVTVPWSVMLRVVATVWFYFVCLGECMEYSFLLVRGCRVGIFLAAIYWGVFMRLCQAGAGFLRYCRFSRNLSANTVRAYAGDLRDFQRFVGDVAVSSCDRSVVECYVADSFECRGLSPATVKRRIACLRMFFSYLASNRYSVS